MSKIITDLTSGALKAGYKIIEQHITHKGEFGQSMRIVKLKEESEENNLWDVQVLIQGDWYWSIEKAGDNPTLYQDEKGAMEYAEYLMRKIKISRSIYGKGK